MPSRDFAAGAKVPPNIQRMQAEDLIAAVFPDQIACAENLAGPREIPDHPLVEQTIADTLTEAMDIEGLESLVARLKDGDVRVVARDLTEPTPLAAEVLDARPYAFLDDAPLEERRARAVTMRRGLDPASAADIGRLDADAIERVREEAWPGAAGVDEVHDALVVLGFATSAEAMAGRAADPAEAARRLASGGNPGWSAHLDTLVASGRATRFRTPGGGPVLWCAAERLAEMEARARGRARRPAARAARGASDLPRPRRGPGGADSRAARMPRARDRGTARLRSRARPGRRRGRARRAGSRRLGAARSVHPPGAASTEWCERRLLARIHRYTLGRLRREIEPVSRADLVRFLFEWQRVTPDDRREGDEALAAVVTELEGFAAPAAAWEEEILPARISCFTSDMLDRLCLAGRASWARPAPPVRETPRRSFGPIRSTPIALFSRQGRRQAPLWLAPGAIDDGRRDGASGTVVPGEAGDPAAQPLSPGADAIRGYLESRGASFFDDILAETGARAPDAAAALGELIAHGLVSADGFAGLRAFTGASARRLRAVAEAGRWSCVARRAAHGGGAGEDGVEAVARTLLRRYGVVFRSLLARESFAVPWRDLLRELRRLEARGDIRGGRFVAGFTGEQYALPEAVETLRRVRRAPADGAIVTLSAADPLNLTGIVCLGDRVPATASARIAFRDGVPIGTLTGGRKIDWIEPQAPEQEWSARNALLRRRIPALPAARPG